MFFLELRLLMLAIIIVSLVFIVSMLRRKQLDMRYSLVWIFGLLGIAVFCIFPWLLFLASGILGIETPVNTLFLICIAFLACICISLTIVVSRLSNRLKQLTQNIAIAEKEHRKSEDDQQQGGKLDV